MTIPENNEFSYLEPEASKKSISFSTAHSAELTPYSDNKLSICGNTDIDLVGILSEIQYYGPPGYGQTPHQDQMIDGLVLKTVKQIELSCGSQKKILTREVLLELPKGMNYEYLLGGTVLARGQVKMSEQTGEILPLKMQVLRLQPVQSTLY